MHFYAFDQDKKLIHAQQAKKDQNYLCIECLTRVRVRGGIHRQLHFYHLDSKRECYLNRKGMAHLHLQNFLLEQLQNECQLEYRFPLIKRIADVAWLPKKIIFEIQCSPISAIEIEQRNQDYSSQGWQVIWIFHDRYYNQKYVTPAEKAVENHPHYFSNMNVKGEGVIYDQFQIIENSRRLVKMPKLIIDIRLPFNMNRLEISQAPLLLLQKKRINHWSLFFKGDLLSIHELTYIEKAVEFEKIYTQIQMKQFWKKIFFSIISVCVIRPYLILFRYLLEKACR